MKEKESAKVQFTYYGQTFEMTYKELNAAFRFMEKEFKKQDVVGMYKEMHEEGLQIGESVECPYSDDDLETIAKRAERILGKCDSYWECYWSCVEQAIQEFEDEKPMG